MNFVQMLFMDVKPFSDHVPSERTVVRKNKLPVVVQKANQAAHEKALAKFKAVMKDEWVHTIEIENRLGYVRSSCLSTLAVWERKKLIVRRNSKTHPTGYEWKFVEKIK